MSFDKQLLTQIIEGALLAVGQPLTVEKLATLFDDDEDHPEPPSKEEIKAVLEDIQSNCDGRGFELVEVGTGWRFQVRAATAPWVNRMWEEKPQKYSRALLETLALIAYRQPITRGDIEEIRGVAVSSHIIKTLSEREWIKVVGHRDVPGRPSLYATTRQFLDYFNLKSLEELPSLGEIKDLEELNKELDLGGDIPEDVKRTLELPSEEDEAQTDGETSSDQEAEGAAEADGEAGSEDASNDADSDAQTQTDTAGEAAIEDAAADESEEAIDSSQDEEQDTDEEILGESAFVENGLDEVALSEAAAPVAIEEESEEDASPLERVLAGDVPEAFESTDDQGLESDSLEVVAEQSDNPEDEMNEESIAEETAVDNSASEEQQPEDKKSSERESLFAPSDAPSVFD